MYRSDAGELSHVCVDEILIVDGGSSDGTVTIAESAGARVIHERRRGYGRACAIGLAKTKGDIGIFYDSRDKHTNT